jgi:S1-C subfamily serine protease
MSLELKSRRNRAGLAGLILGAILGACLVSVFRDGETLPRAYSQAATVAAEPPAATRRDAWPPAATAVLTEEEQRNIAVYESVNRSVVNIYARTVETDSFFGVDREAEGAGSGAVIDKAGHVITNYHVIDGAQEINVTLASNRVCTAELVGGDKEHDIAVLKIEAPEDELFPAQLGRSDDLKVGQRVFVLGNPFGWDGTLTTGIISSLNRNLPSRVPGREMQSLIQTDAAMNPGNSGGPLLNSAGQMIGMCVAIATRTGQSAGVGFAIPIDRIKWILPQLIERGHVVRADIGISDVMPTSAGLIVGRMDPNGPAAQAGLQGFRIVARRRQVGGFVFNETAIDRSQADRILALDGEPMRSAVQFRDKIWSHQPGDVVTLTIAREDREMEVQITLGGN